MCIDNERVQVKEEKKSNNQIANPGLSVHMHMENHKSLHGGYSLGLCFI